METSTDRRLVAWDWLYSNVSHRNNCWYDGNDRAKIQLRQWPINSVTTISISGDTIPAAEADDYYGSTGFVIYDKRGMLYYESGWSSGIQNIRVSYNAGYAAGTPEREELRELCNVLVGVVYGKKSTLGFKSETIGNYSYTKGDLKQAYEIYGYDADHIISKYRRKWGATT